VRVAIYVVLHHRGDQLPDPRVHHLFDDQTDQSTEEGCPTGARGCRRGGRSVAADTRFAQEVRLIGPLLQIGVSALSGRFHPWLSGQTGFSHLSHPCAAQGVHARPFWINASLQQRTVVHHAAMRTGDESKIGLDRRRRDVTTRLVFGGLDRGTNEASVKVRGSLCSIGVSGPASFFRNTKR